MVLEKQTNLYFQRYHLERTDELKMFLENEAFAVCPVSVQFTLFDLPVTFIRLSENFYHMLSTLQ